MTNHCSLNCGTFRGVDPDVFAGKKDDLEAVFKHVRYEPNNALLKLCGAREMSHDPDQLSSIFNLLSSLLSETGKGQILLTCDSHEICFFRKGMWKLMALHVPEDPFEGLHVVE